MRMPPYQSSVCAVGAYFPSVQLLHAVSLYTYVPAGHAPHVVRSEALSWPSGQASHSVAPVLVIYVPDGHSCARGGGVRG